MNTTEKVQVISSIESVIAGCNKVISEAENTEIVAWERDELVKLRSAVEAQWPLSAEQKQKIAIGTVAARNLSDWTPQLANAIMQLDYAVKHDGDHLEQVAIDLN